MWKAQLNRSIKEVRFVLKNSPEHHGVWRFVQSVLPDIRMINQNTFFAISEINDMFQTKSAVHVVYGDDNCTEDEILSEGLSPEDFEKKLKECVAKGLTLENSSFVANNEDLDIPADIVESHKYVEHHFDRF